MSATLHNETEAVTRAASQQVRQYLTFILDGDTYAIDLPHIREIIKYGHITPMPMLPDLIRGVINLRGAAVPVIDLAVHFGSKPGPVTGRSCIVVLDLQIRDEVLVVGIVVDMVYEVVELHDTDIEPLPRLSAQLNTEFIAGMGKVGEEFLLLLDVDKVLSSAELGLIAQVGEAG